MTPPSHNQVPRIMSIEMTRFNEVTEIYNWDICQIFVSNPYAFQNIRAWSLVTDHDTVYYIMQMHNTAEKI